ncbi:EAL domain-containing protein, partial [Paraburkholderia sp. BR10954]|uniref:EAL domain-containing protein n=1 Tax=Paraburkholderia sp. BR10954 TaxID=3236995 RepID=UPI0034D32D4C
VMIVDIDHFKTVNDSLGPLVGDEVLCAVGQRLDDARRAGDTVARLSADEYGVLMDGVLDVKAAVDATLKAHSITPGTLKLEITESLLLDDPGRCLGIMEALKSKGVKLSLDDFGTGWSSLATLRRVPVEALKIDKQFVQAMVE